MNVAAGIRRAVKAFSDQTALRMENEDITYAGLEDAEIKWLVATH
jgi:hypothetical protein